MNKDTNAPTKICHVIEKRYIVELCHATSSDLLDSLSPQFTNHHLYDKFISLKLQL